jgi:uncharacterized protein (TIGR02594 family)
MTLQNRSRAAILLCSVAIVTFTVPALARPAHKAAQAFAAVQSQNAGADQDGRYAAVAQPAKGEATQSPSRRRAAQTQAQANPALGGFTSNSLVSEARKYIGTNPTGRGSLWCGAFMDLVLKKTGHAGGGNLASAYARYGTRVSGPQVGAIAVMGRNGGGHVGVVTGVDANGNPIVVSGNTWNRSTGGRHTVAERVYPRSRVYAYVMPGK